MSELCGHDWTGTPSLKDMAAATYILHQYTLHVPCGRGVARARGAHWAAVAMLVHRRAATIAHSARVQHTGGATHSVAVQARLPQVGPLAALPGGVDHS